jgi:hypothetical protein
MLKSLEINEVKEIGGLNLEILKSFEISSTDSASGGIRRVADGEIKWMGGSSFEILKGWEINVGG